MNAAKRPTARSHALAVGLRRLRALAADERGGEIIEWALVAGLVVIATIVLIGAVGTKVLARWNTVNSGL